MKENSVLQIAEAKLFSNTEIRAESVPPVVEQIKRYEENVAEYEEEIINAYKDYVEIVNELFELHLPKPKDINNTVNLLIFDFDDTQKKGKLQDEVRKIKNYLDTDTSVHEIHVKGDVDKDKDRTILKQLFFDR